jgi:BirA family biotin operon repressor/biotin-[acetyl-CoA-carboxylase] ligase
MLLICCKVTTNLSEINVYRQLTRATLFHTVSCATTQEAIIPLLMSLKGETNKIVALFTDNQMFGKGQRGNTWNSTPNDSLALTIAFPITQPLESDWVVTNKAIAVQICNTVNSYLNQDLQLKWPNDLFLLDKKLGGLLMEIHQDQGCRWLLVGIGINVARVPQEHSGTAISMMDCADQEMNKEEVACTIVESLDGFLRNDLWLADGMDKIEEDYNQRLWKLHQHIEVKFYEGERVVREKMMRLIGVDKLGRVLIEGDSGKIGAFHHGQVRIVAN